jgi:hypothetical protein
MPNEEIRKGKTTLQKGGDTYTHTHTHTHAQNCVSENETGNSDVNVM